MLVALGGAVPRGSHFLLLVLQFQPQNKQEVGRRCTCKQGSRCWKAERYVAPGRFCSEGRAPDSSAEWVTPPRLSRCSSDPAFSELRHHRRFARHFSARHFVAVYDKVTTSSCLVPILPLPYSFPSLSSSPDLLYRSESHDLRLTRLVRPWPSTKSTTRQDDYDTTIHLPRTPMCRRGRGRGRRPLGRSELAPTTSMAQVVATTEEGRLHTSAGHDILVTRILQEHNLSSYKPILQYDIE